MKDFKDDTVEYYRQVKINIKKQGQNESLKKLSVKWRSEASKSKYVYNYEWMGMPVIALPQDIMAMQEIIYKINPDLIIETGVARGGSSVFYASMMKLLGGTGKVISIDIDIRPHNYVKIANHPLSSYIQLIEGSSVDPKVYTKVLGLSKSKKRIMVFLDSNHTHKHVLQELKYYAPMVTKGSYCVVMDTSIEDEPESNFPNRPWGKGNNPRTAVWEYLKINKHFTIDYEIQNKLLITSAPDGFLKKIK